MYHYVYCILNLLENKFYIGVRTSEISPQDDLGKVYFSSSADKEFIKDQKTNPGNYSYMILKMFSDRASAVSFEIELHDKFDVAINESFYNRAKQTALGFDTTGTKRSIESRKKQSDTTKGSKRSNEWAVNISNALKNHPSYKTAEFREKCRQNNLGENNPNYGKSHSDDHKMKISETLINNPKLTCPHCGKEGSKSPMIRWHFDNCKKIN